MFDITALREFMPKKVIIEASLVEEADEMSNEEIERKISNYLEKYPPKFPWVKDIKKVSVKSA